MQNININSIKPYVRYVRNITTIDYNEWNYTVKAYDCRLFYCTSGVGSFEINGNIYPVKTGSLLLFKHNTPYAYIPNEINPMRLFAINFDYTFSSSHLSTPIPPVKAENFDKNKILSPITLDEEILEQPLLINNAFSVENELNLIHTEFTQREIFYEIRCSSLLYSVLTQILRLSVKSQLKSNKIDAVQKIIALLNEKYADQITLSFLGNKFGYHPNYLNQLFIMRTNKSIYAYLQEIRIIKAIDMLQNSTMPIGEIAISVGFGDIAHFSKTFKLKTGLSPSDFRIKG